MGPLTQFKYRFEQFSIAEKLIVINVICFVIPLLLNTLSFLFNGPQNPILGWFELDADVGNLLYKPWTLFTYGFLHTGFFHLFMNMLLLYYSGQFFLNLLPAKTFLNTYILGILFGGLVFLLSYMIFPAFQNVRPYMVGASAGVMAVFIFCCVFTPDQEIRLLFFNVKLKYVGIAFVLIDVLQIPGGNAGGHLAHLGGAGLGLWYAKNLKKGIDIGSPLEKIINSFKSLFSSQKTPLKTVYKAPNKKEAESKKEKQASNQKQIDAILDKISTSGYDSLSDTEKEFLFRAGKDS
ncbi:MAG: rhomboid family intramembrane serine protease [Flavobacteriaceae bacterium]|nr:rhomboid family intramembrane serine protease [Flavobacteriaceae bacterium]